MKKHEYKFQVASDVSSRDGIGIEYYRDEEIIIEIFRDDMKKTREVTLYEKDIPLDVVENSIQIFKEKIDWEFIDYNKLENE